MDVLQARYEKAGQGHVFKFVDALNPSEKEKLIQNLNKFDVERCNRIFLQSTQTKKEAVDTLSPLPESCFDSLITSDAGKIKAWQDMGMKRIAQNQVAVLLLAGGKLLPLLLISRTRNSFGFFCSERML